MRSRAQAGTRWEGPENWGKEGRFLGDLLLCGVPFHTHSDPGWGHRGQGPRQTWLAPKLSVLGRIWVPRAAWKRGAQSLLHVPGHAHHWPPPVGLGSALPLLRAFFGEQCWAGLGNISLTPSGPRLGGQQPPRASESCLSWCLLPLALAVRTAPWAWSWLSAWSHKSLLSGHQTPPPSPQGSLSGGRGSPWWVMGQSGGLITCSQV